MIRLGKPSRKNVSMTISETRVKENSGSAVSGKSNTDAAQSASRTSRTSRAGRATTEHGGQKVDQTQQKTEYSFIPPVINTSTARVYTERSRVPQRAFKRRELLDANVSRAVLRGRDGGNIILLPDTDVKDAEWIADVLRHGLLKASFLPPQPIRILRELSRSRTTLIQERAQEVNRLQKTLEGAPIKLAAGATDV